MSALTYLTLTRLKNGIRDLLRKPARLIYVVFLLIARGICEEDIKALMNHSK